jgi:hypothetical protein
MSSIASASRRRRHTLKAALIVVAVLGAGALGLAAGATAATANASPAQPTAAPSAAALPGSIIVVRRAGTQDSLWSVSASDASATKLIDLPILAARTLASPDNTMIAILPGPSIKRFRSALPAIGSKIYVYDVTHATLRAFSFASHGVQQVDSMTWLSATTILVSGSAIGAQKIYTDAEDRVIDWLGDRLYTVSTTTGRTAAFRNLRGTEPTAAPGHKLIVYARLRDGGPAPAATGARYIVESLIRLKLVPGRGPHVMKEVRYLNSLGIRRFRDPDLSRDGRYVATSTFRTEDVSYMVRTIASGTPLSTTETTFRGLDRTAWSHTSDRVAFWSTPFVGGVVPNETNLYVFDTASRLLTTDTVPTKREVTGLAWAPDDSQLAYSVHSLAHQENDRGELWMIDPGTSGTPTDLGAGSLPVWLP